LRTDWKSFMFSSESFLGRSDPVDNAVCEVCALAKIVGQVGEEVGRRIRNNVRRTTFRLPSFRGCIFPSISAIRCWSFGVIRWRHPLISARGRRLMILWPQLLLSCLDFHIGPVNLILLATEKSRSSSHRPTVSDWSRLYEYRPTCSPEMRASL